MTKLCECGCGRPTSLITKNYPPRGMVRGEYRRFVHGHNKPSLGGHTEKTKEWISRSHVGIKASDSARAKMSAAKAGKPTGRAMVWSDEMKRRIGDTMRARGITVKKPFRPEKGADMSRALARLKDPVVHARRIAALRIALKAPDVQRRRASAAAQSARARGGTSIERAVAAILTAIGVSFQSQYPIDRYVVDFFVPSRALVIECDGTYWHNLPGAAERDAARDVLLVELGYTVLRLPEVDIVGGKANPVILRAVS